MRKHFAALCAVSIAGAASLPLLHGTDIMGPVSGFVVDGRTHSLRPINGLPGSAMLGDAIQLPFAVGLAAASTRLDYALVTDFRGGGETYLARGLRSGAPAVTPLGGAIAASGLVLAASGANAVLYSNALGRLQFVSGLPDNPAASDPIDTTALAGGIASLAIDGAGQTALLVAGDGSLYSVSAGGAPQFIVRVPGAASAALLPNGADAVVGNRDTGDVLLVRDFTGAASVSTLAGARDGIDSAIAVQAVGDQAAGVVDSRGRLATIDLATGGVTWKDLAGPADRLKALDNGLLVLNGAGPQPMLLLDSTQGGSVFFIPPDKSTESHRGRGIWTRH